jgi:hypothetical protein
MIDIPDDIKKKLSEFDQFTIDIYNKIYQEIQKEGKK